MSVALTSGPNAKLVVEVVHGADYYEVDENGERVYDDELLSEVEEEFETEYQIWVHIPETDDWVYQKSFSIFQLEEAVKEVNKINRGEE